MDYLIYFRFALTAIVALWYVQASDDAPIDEGLDEGIIIIGGRLFLLNNPTAPTSDPKHPYASQ